MSNARRVVGIGASNLTRGFQTMVATARAEWGPNVEVFAALGHGRSYGAVSRLFGRSLPAILECGLWDALEQAPRMTTQAFVTDVGNDILYGYSADQVVAWTAEAVKRLRRFADGVVLAGLPMNSIRRTRRLTYLAMRTVLVPACRLSLDDVVNTAERVNKGLRQVAGDEGATLCDMDPSWYGLDPIHIRRAYWPRAWSAILGTDCEGRTSFSEAIRLYRMRPLRRWLLGVEQVTPQGGTPLRSGGRVWLF